MDKDDIVNEDSVGPNEQDASNAMLRSFVVMKIQGSKVIKEPSLTINYSNSINITIHDFQIY